MQPFGEKASTIEATQEAAKKVKKTEKEKKKAEIAEKKAKKAAEESALPEKERAELLSQRERWRTNSKNMRIKAKKNAELAENSTTEELSTQAET